jgi:hypothetical protein
VGGTLISEFQASLPQSLRAGALHRGNAPIRRTIGQRRHSSDSAKTAVYGKGVTMRVA